MFEGSDSGITAESVGFGSRNLSVISTSVKSGVLGGRAPELGLLLRWLLEGRELGVELPAVAEVLRGVDSVELRSGALGRESDLPKGELRVPVNAVLFQWGCRNVSAGALRVVYAGHTERW